MRKIINSTYITLDGAVENPQLWPSFSGGAGSDVSFEIQTSLLHECDAVLMGRRTYEIFASAWPTRSGDKMSDRMNAMQKIAVSTTLRDPAWNNTTVIGRDLVAEIGELKQQPGADIVQYGLGKMSFTLMEHGLLDEIRLWVHPLILGSKGPKAPHFLSCPTTSFNWSIPRRCRVASSSCVIPFSERTAVKDIPGHRVWPSLDRIQGAGREVRSWTQEMSGGENMSQVTHDTAVSSKRLWAGRIISALAALLLLFSGAMKLLKAPAVIVGMAHYGYPEHLILYIGMLEVGCTIIYLIPRTAILGAVLMTAYLGGATATNVRVGDLSLIGPVLAGVFVWAGLYLRDGQLSALIPVRK